MKDNGTQCKRNAKTCTEFCGTHQGWCNVYTPSIISKNVADANVDIYNDLHVKPVKTPKIVVRFVSSLADFLGR